MIQTWQTQIYPIKSTYVAICSYAMKTLTSWLCSGNCGTTSTLTETFHRHSLELRILLGATVFTIYTILLYYNCMMSMEALHSRVIIIMRIIHYIKLAYI